MTRTVSGLSSPPRRQKSGDNSEALAHRPSGPLVSARSHELAALLTKPVRGDGSVVLACEFIAAKFNIATGAGSEDLAAEIDRGDRLLAGLAGRLPYDISPSSPLGHSMVASAGRLAALNNRRSNPGCIATK
jgi:hypothetical protein